MAAKNTVNIQKMQSAATELDRIYSQMIKQIKTLDETMSSVKQVWQGEAANTYLKQYQKNEKAFESMANAIKSASETLFESSSTYGEADSTAMDIVQKMGKR